MKKIIILWIATLLLASNLSFANEHLNNEKIDANSLITILGQPYQQQSFQTIKTRFNAKKPEMDYEAATAFWSFYEKAGVDFNFADEAIFTNLESENLGVGKLYLTEVNFYGSNDSLQFQDTHVLPYGVKYGDDYPLVLERMQLADAEHKIKDNKSENWWALTRADGERYGVSFTFDKDCKVTEAKIHFYFGQDHMEWMNNSHYLKNKP